MSVFIDPSLSEGVPARNPTLVGGLGTLGNFDVLGVLGVHDDVDLLAAALRVRCELDLALHASPQGVVAPDTDVLTGVDASTALTNDDAARLNRLAIEQLYAKALG